MQVWQCIHLKGAVVDLEMCRWKGGRSRLLMLESCPCGEQAENLVLK